MITPRGTFRLLGATTFLALSCFFAGSTTGAAENPLRYADQRIPVEHARPLRVKQDDSPAQSTARRRKSLVSAAAHGQVIDEIPPAPLDGSLVERNLRGNDISQIRQVAYLESHGAGCGPVCDCGDPGCGIEPVCGIDGVVVGEAACGLEVGCGIGAAIERLGPGCGAGGCGVAGCTDCSESSCGIDGIFVDGPGCGFENVGDCSCDACTSPYGGSCEVDCVPLCLPMLRVNWNRFQFFAGVQAYKGPMNFVNTNANNANVRSGSGSFGFHQGFNEGRSLKRWFGWDLASQFGLRATQSNLSGAEFTDETRHQIFITWGLFRRVDYGLQYGLAVDYLNDDWYFQGDLTQIRSELSWKTRGCHVLGFHSISSVDSDRSSTVVDDGAGNVINSSITFESTDQYRFFYRRLLSSSGTWDAFAGWTDNQDGLLGANMNLPLRRCVTLQTGATFLIPNEGASNGGNREEGWNISLGFVYRPGGPTGCGRYSRPMFDVADNGTFMVDRR